MLLLCLPVTFKGGYGYRRSGRDRYGPPTRTEYRLIVENLSSRCSWQDLKVCDVSCVTMKDLYCEEPCSRKVALKSSLFNMDLNT